MPRILPHTPDDSPGPTLPGTQLMIDIGFPLP
jgi:hypothetical protein